MTAIFKNPLLLPAILVLCSPGLSACDITQNALKADREGNMEIQDYRDALASRIPDSEEEKAGQGKDAGAPELQPYVSAEFEDIAPMPLVSISVNQTVPLRDVLFELAKQADMDLELDPRITGSIIFTARQRPLDEVVSRIADMAGLRYTFDDDVFRVELDTPYNKNYKVDYLNYIRKSKGGISNDLSVVSGEGADTGSSFEATTESEQDFWKELDTNIKQILAGQDQNIMRTGSDPVITAMEQNPDVRPLSPQTSTKGNVTVQPPQATLQVGSLPIEGNSSGVGQGSAINSSTSGATYSINKNAGIISVYAADRVQKQVRKYLDLVHKSTTAQVLIEAKILEVSLSDAYATGIDWRAMQPKGDISTLNFFSGTGSAATLSGLGINSSDNNSSIALGYASDDLEAFITALSNFGTVKALASPRVTVINNQPAVLNVASNQVFFKLEFETEEDDDPTTPDKVKITSDAKSVPEGVIVNVLPSINVDDQTISLALRPTITRVLPDSPQDPGVLIVASNLDIPLTGISAEVPELSVQEIDTIVNMRSGQSIVMGGLLQDRTTADEDGIPILSEIPYAGNLFRQNSSSISKTEIVIFLKATILENPSDSIHDTDRDLYRKFSSDRRPFKL